jgi:hypothetical protein
MPFNGCAGFQLTFIAYRRDLITFEPALVNYSEKLHLFHAVAKLSGSGGTDRPASHSTIADGWSMLEKRRPAVPFAKGCRTTVSSEAEICLRLIFAAVGFWYSGQV